MASSREAGSRHVGAVGRDTQWPLPGEAGSRHVGTG